MQPLFRAEHGENYGTPKELWGFRLRGTRTNPEAVAREFLAAHADLFGLSPDLHVLREPPRLIESLGARHVIFQQWHKGLRIFRAYVTVHIGTRRGEIYLVKNRAVPEGLLAEKRLDAAASFALDRAKASRAAERAVSAPGRRRCWKLGAMERFWFPKGRAMLPAWRAIVHLENPRQELILMLHGRTGKVLSSYDNLAEARGRARVFDPNPVIALGDHAWLREQLTRGGRLRKDASIPRSAYRVVALRDLSGNGTLEGRRVSTRLTSKRVRSREHSFVFLHGEQGFAEAMVYFHIDRAVRYLETLGYRGTRRIFTAPIQAAVNATTEDNAWYSPDLRSLTFGTGGIDAATDAETILHELGHAIQDAICPGFGQSPEAAAIGEGFGDYFAASFFAERKPDAYRATVMSWDYITWTQHKGPPCARRIDSRWTYRNYRDGHDEHDNGMIWAATLWDIRAALGRRAADRLILESHFQLDGFTRFARAARAILDADRNLHRGKNLEVLAGIFRDRKIAPVG